MNKNSDENNPKIKILMGMDSYLPVVDGVVNCMHNYCLNLQKTADLTAVAPMNIRGYVDKQPYRIVRCNSMYIPVLKLFYATPGGDIAFNKAVFQKKYDIIHIHSPFNMAKFALKVGKKQDIPVVATFHTNFRPIFKGIFKSQAITEAVVKSIGKLYNKMDEVFVCSPNVAEQARSFGYTGKITYLPFGTDFEKAQNVPELKARANAHFGLQDNELIFLFVGRIMPLKRIDFIIDSLKILKDRGLKFKFYVVGKGMYAKKLAAQALALGLEKEVIFLGFIDRNLFPALYARADLLLFPSLYDNFGLVKVEAAAFSTAGVFIKDSQAGFGVTDGRNGFLCDDNVTAFADKIELAVSDRQLLEQIGVNAGNELYINWQKCSEILLENYERIIKEREERIVKKKNPQKIFKTQGSVIRRASKIKFMRVRAERKQISEYVRNENRQYRLNKNNGGKTRAAAVRNVAKSRRNKEK